MDNVKETFQRLITWAKAHPWVAGLILVGVIILAWWTIKKGGFGGGGGGGTASSSDSTNQTAPDLGSVGGGGDVPASSDLFGSNGGSSGSGLVSYSDPLSGFSQNYGGGASGFGDLYTLPPASEAIPLDTSFFGGAPLASDNMIAFDLGGAPASINQTPLIGDVVKGAANLKAQPAPTAAQPVKSSAPSIGSVIQGAANLKAQPKDTSNYNPAQKLGKGKNFTGYIGTQHYTKGYPDTVTVKTVNNAPSIGSQIVTASGDLRHG